MAIAIDVRQSGTSNAAAASLSWLHNVGSGLTNSILVVCSCQASVSNFTVSGVNWDNGGANTPLTRLGRINDSLSQAWAEIWYLLNPASGNKTIKVTYTGTVAGCTGSSSWSGVNQINPWNVSSPQTATGAEPTQPSVAVTSSVGERVIDAIIDNETATDTLVVGGGQMTIHNITVGGNIAGGSSDEAGAASVTMSWSGVTAGAKWAIIGGSLQPAAAGTSTVIRHPIY